MPSLIKKARGRPQRPTSNIGTARKARRLPRAIPIVPVIRRSPKNTRRPSQRLNYLRSTTYLVAGPKRRRITLLKAASSTKSTKTDRLRKTRVRRERQVRTTQYLAGVWSHNGADADLALRHHLAPARR